MENTKTCSECVLITNAEMFEKVFGISVEELAPKDLSWWQEEYNDEIQV